MVAAPSLQSCSRWTAVSISGYTVSVSLPSTSSLFVCPSQLLSHTFMNEKLLTTKFQSHQNHLLSSHTSTIGTSRVVIQNYCNILQLQKNARPDPNILRLVLLKDAAGRFQLRFQYIAKLQKLKITAQNSYNLAKDKQDLIRLYLTRSATQRCWK